MVLLCEVGKCKGPNHWHVGIFTILGVDELAQGAGMVLEEYRIQDGSLGHSALRPVIEIDSNQHTFAWESALGLANPTYFFLMLTAGQFIERSQSTQVITSP